MLRRQNILVTRVREAINARCKMSYPLTNDALTALQVAMESEFRARRGVVGRVKVSGMAYGGKGRARKGKARRRMLPVCRESMKLLQKVLNRRGSTITTLEAKLGSETRAKGRGGLITAEWLTRCALAAPTVSLRSLARSFKDIQGQDATVVSRTTIKAARGALVETLKLETGAYARRVVVRNGLGLVPNTKLSTPC